MSRPDTNCEVARWRRGFTTITVTNGKYLSLGDYKIMTSNAQSNAKRKG